MRPSIIHPLFNQSKIDIEELLNHCDDNAANVLKAASLLADYRTHTQEKIKKLHNSLCTPPWSEKVLKFNFPNAEVMPIDLLRAIMATHKMNLYQSVFRNFEKFKFGKIIDSFHSDATYWADILRKQDKILITKRLENRWMRRWQMAFLRKPDCEIDLPRLISSIPRRVLGSLANYHDMYVGHLITINEFEVKTVVSMIESGIEPLESVPAAYFDRHNLFEMMSGTFREKNILILTGNAFSGRTALTDAWLSDHRRNSFDVQILNQNDSKSVGKGKLSSDNCIFCVSGYGEGIDLKGSENHRDLASIKKNNFDGIIREICFRSIRENSKSKFVIKITHDEYKKLSSRIPEFENIPHINVPDLEMKDIIPILICQKPKLEDVEDTSVDYLSLSVILKVLKILETGDEIIIQANDEETGHNSQWSSHENILSLLKKRKLIYTIQKLHDSSAIGNGSRILNKVKSGNDAPIISKGMRMIIEKYVGSFDQLKELIDFDDKLSTI